MSLLPDPPSGHHHWSIVTLADHLRVAPAVVDALLAPSPDGADGDSSDIRSGRQGHSYGMPDGESRGDCWLWGEASARIAEALPAAAVARRFLDDPAEALRTMGAPALEAMARHILGQYEGGDA